MIKFTQGWIGEQNGEATHDIVVKAAAQNTLKDAMIGIGIVMVGIIYLTYTAFKHGAKQFEMAELYALRDAGAIDYDPEKVS